MNKLIVALILSLFILAVSAQDDAASTSTDAAPKLLVQKSVKEFEAVLNQNFTFSFSLYNVGQGSAYGVKLEDVQLPESDFVYVDGKAQTSFEKIAPGEKVTYSYTIQAKNLGEILSKPAAVSYKVSSDDAAEEKVARSTELPTIPVLSAVDYEKKHDKHYDEWLVFALLSLLPVGLPYFVYQYATSQVYKMAELKASAAAQE